MRFLLILCLTCAVHAQDSLSVENDNVSNQPQPVTPTAVAQLPFQPESHANLEQYGDRNSGTILQLTPEELSAGNSAQLYQTGCYNEAEIVQRGNNNSSIITQNGNYNSAFQEINGNENSISLEQYGIENSAYQKINTDRNSITAVQNGVENQLIHVESQRHSQNIRIIQNGTGITTKVTNGY